MKATQGITPQETCTNTNEKQSTTSHKFGTGFVLRAIIGLSLLIIIITRVDFHTVGRLFRATDHFYLSLTFLLLLLDRILMSYKWNLLTNAKGIKLSVWQSYKIYQISQFLGILLPTGIGGDLYRIYHTSKRVGHGEEITASVILERFLGIIAGALFAVLGLMLMISISPQLSGATSLFMIALGVLTFCIVVFWISIQDVTVTSVRYMRDKWVNNWILKKWLQCQQSYVEYRSHGKSLVLFFLLSLVVASVLVLANYYAARAMGLTVGLVYFIGIIPICYLVIRISISINSIGIREGIYGLLFSMVGVSVSESFSLALIVRFGDWLFVLAGGIFYLMDSASEKKAMVRTNC